jgi:hypothetical protein
MTAEIPGRGTIQITLRSPEWGDTLRLGRRWNVGQTEAGSQFFQDEGIETEFYEATFSDLNLCERADLEAFFAQDAVNKRGFPFLLEVTENTSLGFVVGTAQGLSTLDGVSTADVVVPTTASFGFVRLDQSEVEFAATPGGRYTTSLRFRREQQPVC